MTSTPLTPAATPEIHEPPTPPLPPGTHTADRTRLINPKPVVGSNVAAVMMANPVDYLTPASRQVLSNALQAAPASIAPEAAAAADSLRRHPRGEKLVQTKIAGLEPAEAAQALVRWHLRERAVNALAGHSGAIVSKLLEPLTQEPDRSRREAALATVAALAGRSTGSYELAALLRGAKCLPDVHDWRTADLVPGSDPVGALAARTPGAPDTYDDPEAARKAEVDLTPLFSSPKWEHNSDLSAHRGLVGEGLRIADLEEDLKPGQQVIQGILVLESPPDLWRIQDPDAAKAWAREKGFHDGWLYEYKAPDGATHFGVIRTEIDAAVFEKAQDGRLAAVRMDNVKAGIGNANKAQQQNDTAKAAWTNPDFQFLFPLPNGGYFIPELDRSPESAARIATSTVGPLDDPRYQEHLALSMHDITRLATVHT